MFTREFFERIGWDWDEKAGEAASSPCRRLWMCRPRDPDARVCFTDGTGEVVYLPRSAYASPNALLMTAHLLGVSTSDTRPHVYVIMKGAAEGCFLSEQEANSQAADIGSRFYGSGVEVEVHHVPLGPADGPL